MNDIKSIFLLLVMLLSVVSANAADSLTADTLTINPGETKALALRLANKTKYRAFETEITLPDGLSFEKKEDGLPDVTLTDRVPSSFVNTSVFKSQQTLKIVSYSNNNDVIKGDAGVVVKIMVKAGDNFIDGNVSVKNTIFTTEVNQDSKLEDTETNITSKTILTVTVNNASRQYGDDNPSFTLSYSGFRNGESESSLASVPYVTTTASRTSNVGEYSLVAKGGESNHYIFKYVNGSLTITKAPLKISAGNYTKKQGDKMPEFKASYDGFKNGENEDVLTTKPSFSTDANEGSEPGNYEVRISGAEAQNYDISYVNGTLTVISADGVSVTARSYTRVYGDDNPNFEFTADGADLEGTPEIVCDATKDSPVGTYPIVIRQGSITNYNVSYINGTLTITKAPLKISAGNYTKKQGDKMPEFKASYDGFKNGENEDVLTTKPSFSTDANESSEPGNYEVRVGGAEAQNYDISYVNGTLTVISADGVSVTARSYTRVYGDDNPNFEFTSDGAALDGTPEITCDATKESPVGTYPIVIRQGSITNYNVSYINGTLTITKAPLKISVGNYTKKQGEQMPEFKASYDGFKNGENEDVLTTKPSFSTDANEGSRPGNYEVRVGGAEAQNYDISYVNGTLTVISADGVSVTARSYTRVYGDDNPNFEFTVDGAALDGTPEITCEAAKGSPVGTYPIVIRQGSITNYNVSYINGTLTITKAPLKISAGNYTKKQGDAMPEFKASYDGFKNGENEDVLTTKPSFSTDAKEGSEPGNYEVRVGGAEAQNYDISYVNGTLTVIAADGVSVTAKSYTRVYGDDNPNFEFTSDGAALDGTPEITCEATKGSPVGTYPIVIRQGSITNYNVSYINGTLTITKAPLTISAGNYTKKQGDAMPEFKAGYDGFKNGENEDVLSTKPSFSTDANEGSRPGNYEVRVGGAEAQNYDISYVNGTLTVIAADGVSVTARSYTRVYGDDNPTFEFTVDGAALEGTPEIVCDATKDSPVGTYPIVIRQGSITNYNVSYINGTLTITKAPLKISAGNYTKKQGDAMPEFKAGYDGFKNGENEDALSTKPSFSTDANVGSEPGNYEVRVGGAEAQNYDISYVNGTLTVISADGVSVTARSYTRVYGDDNPNFEFTVDGAALEGTPEITCDATKESPVGTYPIVIRQGSITNYNVSYINGTLTITKAPLKISAGNYTKKKGEQMPEFKASYEGFKNGENEDVLTTKPSFSTDANEGSGPGNYEVRVSGAEAQNYDISYVNGTLTVVQSKVDAPVISIDNGVLTITCPTDGATIYYTLDGTEPNEGSRVYSEPVALSASCYIKAFAKEDGLETSEIVNGEYHNAQYPDIVKVGDVFPDYIINNGNDNLLQYFEITSVYPFEIKLKPRVDYEKDWDRSSVYGTVEVPVSLKHDGVVYSITKIGGSSLAYYPNVTSFNLNNGLREIEGSAFRGTSTKEIVIPNSVDVLGGVNFTECFNLEKVVLGSGLQEIGVYAFCACWNENFKKLYSLNPVPPVFDDPEQSFMFEEWESLPDGFTLYVPIGSKSAYETAPGWEKLYGHIKEFDPTGIKSITIDKAHADGYWYTLSGVRLDKKPVKEGVYLHDGKKVIIKR